MVFNLSGLWHTYENFECLDLKKNVEITRSYASNQSHPKLIVSQFEANSRFFRRRHQAIDVDSHTTESKIIFII